MVDCTVNGMIRISREVLKKLEEHDSIESHNLKLKIDEVMKDLEDVYNAEDYKQEDVDEQKIICNRFVWDGMFFLYREQGIYEDIFKLKERANTASEELRARIISMEGNNEIKSNSYMKDFVYEKKLSKLLRDLKHATYIVDSGAVKFVEEVEEYIK